MKLDATPNLHPSASVNSSELGTYTEIGADCILQNAVMGDYSYCGPRCDIANARIGKFVNIASNVRIGPTDHPLDRASMHHFLYRSSWYWDDAADDADFFAARAQRITHIGHDTWIGHGAIIKPGITIGNGAVVAAGALVTKDVAPYSIVAGLPAAPLRNRLAPDLAARLDALEWWDWPHDLLRRRLDDFRNLPVADFLRKYEAV